jgi:hypothetical protein
MVLGAGPPKGPSFSQRLSAGVGRGLETASTMYQQHQAEQEELRKVRQLAQVYNQFGIPEGTPPELAKTYLAEKMRGQRPEKPLTALQESQKKLADERLNQTRSRSKLFESLTSGGRPSAPNEGQSQSGIQNFPEDKLSQAAAFAGQPGEEGIIGNMAKAELDRRIADKKFNEEQRLKSPEYTREHKLTEAQAQADIKYSTDLNERRSKQILKKESLDRLNALTKKKVTGKLYETFLDKFGLTGKTSEGRREYAAEVKNQFTDFKSIAGSQLSAQEFFTLSNAYPNPDFSPEANQAIIDNLYLVHDTLDKEEEIAKRLKKENKGKIPEDYQQKVNEDLQKYVKEKTNRIKDNVRKIMNAQYGIQPGFTLMFDQNGEPLNVPDADVSKLLDGGLADLP